MRFLLLVAGAAGLMAQPASPVVDQGRVGPATASDGTFAPFRLARTGELSVSDAHARYYEAVVRGNVYTASTIQATVATANNSPLIAAGTPLLGIFNPANSGKMIVILRAIVCGVSGTPAAQPLFIWNVISQAAITVGGSNGVNNLTFTSNSAARVFMNAVTTGSPPATVLRPLGGSSSAAIAASSQACSSEDTAGEIIVPPGGFAGIAVGNAAGTTWIVSASATWEEVPL